MTTRLISARFSQGAARTRPPSRAIQEHQWPFIDAVQKKLRMGQYELRHFGCPCGSVQDDVVIAETDRYGLPLTSVLCMGCGTIRIDPYLDEASLTDFYLHVYQRMYGRTEDMGQWFSRQESHGRRILASVRPWLAPGSWVHEYGCGAGGALRIFSDAGYNVAGSDYSEELIEYGRGRGVENLHCGSSDAVTSAGLPKADLIYLHHVLEHVGDPVEMLIGCRANLRSSGRIAVIVPDVSRIDKFAHPAGDLLPFLHIAHKYNFSAEGLRRIARRAGYRAGPPVRATESPEMWMEIVPADEAAVHDVEEAAPAGRAMLDRLTRIERRRRLGLCRGQFRRGWEVATERVRRRR